MARSRNRLPCSLMCIGLIALYHSLLAVVLMQHWVAASAGLQQEKLELTSRVADLSGRLSVLQQRSKCHSQGSMQSFEVALVHSYCLRGLQLWHCIAKWQRPKALAKIEDRSAPPVATRRRSGDHGAGPRQRGPQN